MRLIVDTLAETTGWTPVNNGVVTGLNGYEDYIAGGQSASLLINLPASGDGVEKTYTAIDIDDYDELRFSVFGQGFIQTDYATKGGYGLKLILNSTDTYFVPLWGSFTTVNLDVADLTEITSIRFESVSSADTDLELVISELQVVLDEFPIDILTAIDEQVGVFVEPIQTKYPVGIVTAAAGATDITIRDNGNPVNLQYLDRYMLIQIGDEIHGIEDKAPIDGGSVELTMTQYFDGASMQSTFTDETVYIHTDVTFGRKDDSVMAIPAITAWGFTPENYKIATDIEVIADSFKDDDTFRVRQIGEYFEYVILLDCESRSTEILGELSSLTRKFLAQKTLWVNGLKCLIDFDGVPNEVVPDTHYEIIPKIQYPMTVRIREEIWERTIASKVTSTTVTAEIQ